MHSKTNHEKNRAIIMYASRDIFCYLLLFYTNGFFSTFNQQTNRMESKKGRSVAAPIVLVMHLSGDSVTTGATEN